ncbi:MAG: mannose-6-phosphate isomerase, class I [Chitinophagaceae bacterium]
MPGIYRLKGVVKHYDWGGSYFIPSLLQTENKESRPFAEYWMGVHPLGMSKVETEAGEWKDLSEYTSRLPYLFKLLDVKEMLSIQAHPSKSAAETEFARENAAGIPLDSPLRNYKDDNHKPELMVALSEFWLLHGFKPVEELAYTLQNVVELRELLPVFNESGYKGLYQHIMEMPQAEVNRILQPLVQNLCSLEKGIDPDKNEEDFWAAKAAERFSASDNIDRGLFSIYLFNLVQLKKGEGIFQADGVPHAYLEGQNVEIMANSDNVLRGGLTSKHIDVKELMKHIEFGPTIPKILSPEPLTDSEQIYRTDVPDFRLTVFDLKAGGTVSFSPFATEILLLTEGNITLNNGTQSLSCKPGSPSIVALPGEPVALTAVTNSIVYRAALP